MDKKKEKLYTIEDIVKAVNHWSMVSISKENVISFVEKQKKDEKDDSQLSFWNH
jgi:hypothetical protein